MRINTRRRMWQFFFAWDFLRELIVGTITLERRFADKTATLDAEMLLHERERVSAPDLGHAYAVDSLSSCDSEVRVCGRAKEISIEAGLLLDLWPLFEIGACVWQFVELRHLSRPTQRNCDRIVPVPWRDQRCNDQLTFDRFRRNAFFCDRDLNKIASADSKRRRESRTHEGGIVPSESCNWIRQFLKPAVIGVASVIHFVTWCEHNFR